jgi:hypothetical protein
VRFGCAISWPFLKERSSVELVIGVFGFLVIADAALLFVIYRLLFSVSSTVGECLSLPVTIFSFASTC